MLMLMKAVTADRDRAGLVHHIKGCKSLCRQQACQWLTSLLSAFWGRGSFLQWAKSRKFQGSELVTATSPRYTAVHIPNGPSNIDNYCNMNFMKGWHANWCLSWVHMFHEIYMRINPTCLSSPCNMIDQCNGDIAMPITFDCATLQICAQSGECLQFSAKVWVCKCSNPITCFPPFMFNGSFMLGTCFSRQQACKC